MSGVPVGECGNGHEAKRKRPIDKGWNQDKVRLVRHSQRKRGAN